MGVTRFGRSTDNDYYLDSAKLKNFISRSHAEIHAKKSEDGQYVFVLHNKGLNGTFINDIKVTTICTIDLERPLLKTPFFFII